MGFPGGGPSGTVRASIIPNDDLFDQYQWNLRQIRAPDAWDLTTGASRVVIAVLDTGVALTHPDLVRKLVPGRNFVNEGAPPDDDHGNGTHVAGIAAADTNNGAGIAGIAWQARVMPVKVLDASARGDPAVAARGLIWAVDNGATIVNLGLTSPEPSDALAAALEYAFGRGVVVIAPVANSGVSELSFPAAHPTVIGVGATDRSDQRLATSAMGSYISVAAPGERIASTFRGPGGTDTYAVASSTAQAAAHVTGVVALMLAINPALSPAEVRSILETTADDTGPPGRDPETGAGRINASRAVQFAAPWNFYPSGAGSYTASVSPSPSLYLPLVAKSSGGWSTSFSVQNTSAKPVGINVQMVDSDGRPAHSFSASLAPFASATYQASQLAGLPNGFIGAAAIYAEGPIAGVVNQDQPGRDRLTYEGATSGAHALWAPLLMRAFNGWDTGIRIQNVSGSSARARVTYYSVGSSAPLAESVVTLPPLGSATLYQPSDARIPESWLGAAAIESLDEQLLAAVVNAISASGANASYVPTSSPGSAVHAPLVFKNTATWNTSLHLYNPSAMPANLTVAYLSSSDMTAWTTRRTIEPNGSATAPGFGADEPPDGFVGSAVARVLGGGTLAGVAHQVRTGGTAGSAYRLPGEGAPTLYLPLVYRGFAGWDTGVQVQSLGTASTRVTMTLYQQDGSVATSIQDEVAPGASITFYLPSLTALPAGFVGSAILTSTGSVPIVAVANHVK